MFKVIGYIKYKKVYYYESLWLKYNKNEYKFENKLFIIGL